MTSIKWYMYTLISLVYLGGAAGAVSRITGTLGKGLATLTLDDEYQRKRREALNKKPANAREGFARGGKGLVMVNTHSLQHTRQGNSLKLTKMCFFENKL